MTIRTGWGKYPEAAHAHRLRVAAAQSDGRTLTNYVLVAPMPQTRPQVAELMSCLQGQARCSYLRLDRAKPNGDEDSAIWIRTRALPRGGDQEGLSSLNEA
jgi:hypothetical protein